MYLQPTESPMHSKVSNTALLPIGITANSKSNLEASLFYSGLSRTVQSSFTLSMIRKRWEANLLGLEDS
jgi:hypothetical protein